MADSPSSRRTDLFTQVAAFCFALACVVFAGYKVMKLRGMENPPADMGLNFPAPKRKVITDDTILVDSLTTGSVEPLDQSEPARILQPYTADAPIQDYRFLKVISGLAFVEVQTLHGKEIVSLAEGSYLPGAGVVQRISRIDGRWTLRAGDVTLRQETQ